MDVPLGKPTAYPDVYDPSLLASIERGAARRRLGLEGALPFVGEDVWTGYELSWLAPSGLPRVAVVRLRFDSASPRMVESKSMKLYLNGFAQARFESAEAVAAVLRQDLEEATCAPVRVALEDLRGAEPAAGKLPGEYLDGLNVTIEVYERSPDLLRCTGDPAREEALHTNLFRSLCPVTGQPDWATVLVRYRGAPIDRPSLLRYLVSYRRHPAFHEDTVEQIFVDLKQRCHCERLLVAGFFLRRGGLDINPFRADPGETWNMMRLIRQ